MTFACIRPFFHQLQVVIGKSPEKSFGDVESFSMIKFFVRSTRLINHLREMGKHVAIEWLGHLPGVAFEAIDELGGVEDFDG